MPIQLPLKKTSLRDGQKFSLRLFSFENKMCLTGQAFVASSFLARGKGLLGKKTLEKSQGLWIYPCNSIHTFFMQFPIDVVFLNKQGKIVQVYFGLKPFRLSWLHFLAYSCLEFPAGFLNPQLNWQGGSVQIEAEP